MGVPLGHQLHGVLEKPPSIDENVPLKMPIYKGFPSTPCSIAGYIL